MSEIPCDPRAISSAGSMDIQESGISKLKDGQDAIALSINSIANL